MIKRDRMIKVDIKIGGKTVKPHQAEKEFSKAVRKILGPAIKKYVSGRIRNASGDPTTSVSYSGDPLKNPVTLNIRGNKDALEKVKKNLKISKSGEK